MYAQIRVVATLLALLFAALAGCSDETKPAGGGATTQKCIDGATLPCDCADGGKGTQSCSAGVLGSCVCGVSQADTSDTSGDISAPDVAGPDSESDTKPDTSADCPGGPGCACKDNGDCQTGLCIDDDNVVSGRACAKKCENSCSSGYTCANVPGAGGDIGSMCMPKFLHLCEPCSASKDCESLGLKDSACVDQGALGKFCGVLCSSETDCPADYACAQVPTAEGGSLKQCVKKADDKLAPFGVCGCTNGAVQKKLATACFVEVKDPQGNVTGKCAGVRTCTNAGLSACAAPEAKAEVCNGVDDDCDGQTDEASCDDGKPCTKDTCDGKSGCKYAELDGDPCDADGTVCTENDKCAAGVCVAGGKKDCDDKNPCTSDSCDLAKGCTQVADDGKPCDADGTACTSGDVCQGAKCQQGQQVACDDGNPCTKDSCDAKTGQCVSTPVKDGIPCDDGTKCTKQDVCESGSCTGVAVNCDDSNPCTDDVCDKANGCSPQALTGGPCTDDNPCMIGDLCDAGACQPGQPKVCASPNSCVLATCDLTQKGACTFKNTKAGTPCDDGSACTDKDGCADGSCDGTIINCDDGNACTSDSCDAKTGCASANNTSPCSDGNACTLLDKCAGGLCVGKVLDAKVDCDDGNPCTSDSCEPKGGCTHSNNQLACDDGNPCTQGDQCANGGCVGGSNTCGCQNDNDCDKVDDTDLCNGVLYCDKSVAGQFACKTKPGSVVQCNIELNTQCSQQVCDPAVGKCGAVFVQDGKLCDADGSVCTSGDACKSGVCAVGGGVDCDDKNPCTTDSCDAKLGCANVANTAPCDADGSLCTVGDTCADKVCLAGAKKPCDDGEVCTTDSCNPTTGGCIFDGAPQQGSACDADGSVCTVGDACASGKCAPGQVKSCNDNNQCTDDSCDKAKGCVFAPNSQPCDDGNACTQNDLCVASQCAGKSLNPQVDCDDGQVCTTDACDPKVGCTHSANQAPCDDGNPCTQGDLCAAKSCTSGSNVCGCQKDADCAAQEDGDLCNGTLFCDTAKLPYTCKVKASTVVVCDASKDTTCATNLCAAQTGKCSLVSALDGKACDADGSVCTSGDACAAGLCKAGATVDCDDKNLCTTDSCDAKTGCAHANNTLGCDADGSVCTQNDACTAGVCKQGVYLDCEDNNVCTDDSCDAKLGCVNANNTAACNDGNACTSGDVCAGAKCAGKAVTCDDKNPCTTDSCDAKLGCANVANTAPCDADGSLCTVGDTCADKVCLAGAKKPCDDGEVCTTDSCNPTTGGCIFDGAPQQGSACDADGSVCTVGDACASGKCAPGQVKSCNDNNQCTDDSCDKAKGCVFAPNSQPCDDGNACTQNDLCVASQCAGKSLNPQVDCDDGQVCTTDACDPKVGCTHSANQAPCDDGNPCTQGDLCAAKSCTSGSNVCGCQKDADCAAQEDGDLCNGTLFCDTAKLPYTCKVKASTVVVCDASKDTTCATNLCAAQTGKCSLVSALDGKACDADGSVCTSGDACAAGLCKAGATVDCDDKNLCTTDSCDAKTGCAHANNTLGCDADGSVCTQNDACTAGVCKQGVYLDCEDNNVCTDDSCDAKLGCVNANNTAACNDGSACTSGDVCAGAKCAGKAVTCDDKDPCTADSCDAAKGCVATQLAETADCSADGKSWCLAGKCVVKAVCGNGVVEGTEGCDAGGLNGGGACDANCALLTCSPSFGTPTTLSTDVSFGKLRQVMGSPQPELVGLTASQNQVLVYTGTQASGFQLAWTEPAGSSCGTQGWAVGDFDGDGLTDVLVAHCDMGGGYSGVARIYRGLGSTFAVTAWWKTSGSPHWPNGVSAANIDGVGPSEFMLHQTDVAVCPYISTTYATASGVPVASDTPGVTTLTPTNIL